MNVFFVLLVAVSTQAQVEKSFQRFPLDKERLVYADSLQLSATQNNDLPTKAEALYLYGKIYARAGDYSSSQRYFLQSLQLVRQLGDTANMARLYNRMSENEHVLHHYEQAHIHAKEALRLSEKINEKRQETIAYSNLAKVFESFWMNNEAGNATSYDSSLVFLKRAEQIQNEIGNLEGMGWTKLGIGQLLNRKKDAAGVDYIESAIRMFRADGRFSSIPTALLSLAEAQIGLKRLDQALKTLLEVETICRQNQLSDYNVEIKLKRLKAEYYKMRGDYPGALKETEELQSLVNSQLRVERENMYTMLQNELDAVQKEKDLVIKSQQLERRSVQLKWLSGMLVILSGVGAMLYRLYRNKKKISEQNIQLVQEQAHRVRNHLQMTSNLLRLQSRSMPDSAARLALEESELRVKAIALLQKELYGSRHSADTEIDSYITKLVDSILQACGQEKVNQELLVSKVKVDAETVLSISLILNELVTNSCKYAFPLSSEPMFCLRLELKEDRMYFSYYDNGPGFDADSTTESFGLRLIRMQAEQLMADFDFWKSDMQMGFRMKFAL